MVNPLNQLPVDAGMVRKVDELAAECARVTGHLVVLMVMKEDGKTIIAMEGVPKEGPLAELAKDPPGLMMMAAQLCRLSDLLDEGEARQ